MSAPGAGGPTAPGEGRPTAPGEGDLIVAGVARLGRILRASGVQVGPSRIQDALLALGAVELSDRAQIYWALRCTLLSRREEIEAFDRAFAELREPATEPPEPATPGASPKPEPPSTPDPHSPGSEPQLAETDVASDEPEPDELDETEAGMRFSAVERLRELDFALYTDAELRRARALIERISRAVPLRRSRRLRSAVNGRVFDMRRTLRESMRSDGYPLARLWREPRLVPRRLVFVVDVSGSMQPYARAMVMFLQAAVRAGRRVEAFTFGTRLTRVTPQLQARDPDVALHAATQVVHDWAGGTRIGENLRALSDQWGRMGLTRGAVIVIVSDGWERGEIGSLVAEMERLQRAAHTIVWVNPLAGEPGYEPLAQGMAAALPYIDHFLPGHNLHSFETLAEVLEGLPSHGRARRPRSARTHALR